MKKFLCSVLGLNLFKKEAFKKEVFSLIKFLIGFGIFSTLFFKPCNVPSGSMIPNLLVGDFLVVNKFAYGYTRYSLPFGYLIPWFKGSLMDDTLPKVGDIAVFNNPLDDGKDYVKRVIAIENDTVQMIDGFLYVNSKKCDIEKTIDFNYDNYGKNVMVPQFIETLPNGFKHTFIKYIPFGKAQNFNHDPMYSSDNTKLMTVPKDHFLVIGDNRDGSMDSRFMNNKIGFIHKNQLVGKASMIFFSTSAKWYEIHKWLTSIRFDRIFSIPK